MITCFGCDDEDYTCNECTTAQDEKETRCENCISTRLSGRFHHKICCVHLRLEFVSFPLTRWDIILHGLHINIWLKNNLPTFLHFATHLTFLSVYLSGLRHSGPSALNDERQNLLLCTSATAVLFWYCNETEQAVCVCVRVCVVSSLSNG